MARPTGLPHYAEWAALGSVGVAVFGVMLLLVDGAVTTPLLGAFGVGFSIRLDAVSITMFSLVSFIGWIVLRYARRYMDGEERQGLFTAWLCLTLASVMMIVLAGNLLQLLGAWIATSLFLHRLLLFYPERPAAQRAVRKRIILARLSDGGLLVVAGLLIATYGTGDIASILAQIGDAPLPSMALAAAILLAVIAVLKTAQFPTHGWLTEVMETPTPVSATLHAGVINAGGFLLIRFADLMVASPGSLAFLVMIGGFTAVFAGLVMLTQPAVKTSLAWSTIAQMGFMILQCGLALFSLALLHIVAHSLYKAHSFLAAGGAVENVASIRRSGPIAVPGGRAVGQAFLVALLIYGAVSVVFSLIPGLVEKSPQAIALGAILIFGVAYLLAQGFADLAPGALTKKTAFYSVIAAVGYFSLQTLADLMMAGTLPPVPNPGPLEWGLVVLAVISFAVVAVAQAMFPLWAYHPAATGLRVHLSNGLYADAVFDRLIGGWTVARTLGGEANEVRQSSTKTAPRTL
ncbi:MAG: NADH-quinone oxidoreductase subunit L [Pseudomonadota bacterium]